MIYEKERRESSYVSVNTLIGHPKNPALISSKPQTGVAPEEQGATTGGNSHLPTTSSSPAGNLEISKPSDPAELEADRVAEEINLTPRITQSSKLKNQPVMKAGTLHPKESTPRLPGGIHQLSSGSPLGDAERNFFEPRLGADFSGVKIHTDEHAAGMAETINAKAFTKGNDIVFAKGEYQPGTGSGKRLMAHELTHVVQQGDNSGIKARINPQQISLKPVDPKTESEKFEVTKTKLFGLEKVYQDYQLYKSILCNSSIMVTSGDMAGYAIGNNIAGQFAANQLREKISTELKLYGYSGGITDFEQFIKDYEAAFEKESVSIANDLLDYYLKTLDKANELYSNDNVIQKLFTGLAEARGHYQKAKEYRDLYTAMSYGSQGFAFPWSPQIKMLEKMKQESELGRKGVDKLTQNNPLFKDDHLPEGKRLNKESIALAKNSKELQTVLLKYVNDRKNDIEETRKHLVKDSKLIYGLNNLISETYRRQAIEPNSIYDLIIRDKARDLKFEEMAINISVAILAVALGIVSFGEGTLATIAAFGVAGLSGYNVYQELKDYETKSDIAGTGLTSEDASIVWVVVAIVGAGLDMGAAIKAARTLKPAVKAMEATGDLARFEDGIQALVKAKNIDAKIADTLMEAAQARASFQKASEGLTRRLMSKVYSFPGPLTDPDVYAELVKMAYFKIKEGVKSFQVFYQEIKKARALAKLSDMTPQELTKLKEAWEEAMNSVKEPLYSETGRNSVEELYKSTVVSGEKEAFKLKVYKRNQAELDALATDPAIGNRITPKTIREREVGLACELRGLIPGPIKRDLSGAAEFIDATRQKWDVKAFNSNFTPIKGGYDLNSAIANIKKSLQSGEKVIIDTQNLIPQHLNELKLELYKLSLANNIIFWP